MENRRRLAFGTAAVSVALLAVAGCGTGGNGDKTLVQPAGGSVTAKDGAYGSGGSAGSANSGDSGSDGYGSGSGSGSGYDSGYGSGSDSDAGSDSGADSADSAARRIPAKQLGVRDVPGVGPAVTDSRGFTLYRFDKDTANPSDATCEGACAMTWPPVPADDATAGSLIDPQLLGEVVRGDGTKQLTLAGWPVYRYRPDTRPGEAKGEGVGGTWHVLGSDGKPAPDPGATPGAGGSAGGGGSQTRPSGDQLIARQNPALGTILVDAMGRTLYRFDKDSAWPMKTRCTGACLDVWKPAKPVDRTRVRGVDPRIVNTFTRPDGSRQLAVDCWILYTYTGDTKPGDINGQGKGGVWWAAKENGKKAGR